MGYLIDNNSGTTSFYDPTYSNLSANISSIISPTSGTYYLLPALYQGAARLINFNFATRLTTTSTGDFSFTVDLPNNYSIYGIPANIPFTCNATGSNFNVLHLNANYNPNPNLIDCLVHSSNTITNGTLIFTVQLYVSI